jgi:hypothetical protein
MRASDNMDALTEQDDAVRKVLVVGLGSLARKLIADLCAAHGPRLELAVLTRSGAGSEWCRIQSLVSGSAVDAEIGDALDGHFLRDTLQRHKPHLVIQCASLLSPYFLSNHPLRDLSRQTGFAFQLSAQLPVAMALMRAVHQAAPEARVINCSFPDAVNPILQRIGLAPLTGLGNAGILHYLIEQDLRRQGRSVELTVHAHHVHAIAVLKNQSLPDAPEPIVVIEGQRAAWDRVRPRFQRPLDGDEINLLTSASARAPLRSLLGAPGRLKTSLAGTHGIAGGVPVILERGGLQPDDSAALVAQDRDEFFRACGRCDGIESISAQGVVSFSEHYKRLVAPLSSVLCEPLVPNAALATFRVLQEVIGRHQALSTQS